MTFYNSNAQVVYKVNAYLEEKPNISNEYFIKILNPFKKIDYKEYVITENDRFYYSRKDAGTLPSRNLLPDSKSKFSKFSFEKIPNSVSFFKNIEDDLI